MFSIIYDYFILFELVLYFSVGWGWEVGRLGVVIRYFFLQCSAVRWGRWVVAVRYGWEMRNVRVFFMVVRGANFSTASGSSFNRTKKNWKKIQVRNNGKFNRNSKIRLKNENYGCTKKIKNEESHFLKHFYTCGEGKKKKKINYNRFEYLSWTISIAKP